MEKFKSRLVVVLALMLVGVVSCSSSSDPSGPSILDVAGIWNFVGQLTQNTCNLDAVSTLGGNMTFNQNGSAVSTGQISLGIINGGSAWSFIYSGTLTGSNVSMAAANPYVLTSGGTVIHFGSGIEVQNIQDNAGTGSLNITGACIQGCTGGCQTIWTGTWTKQ